MVIVIRLLQPLAPVLQYLSYTFIGIEDMFTAIDFTCNLYVLCLVIFFRYAKHNVLISFEIHGNTLQADISLSSSYHPSRKQRFFFRFFFFSFVRPWFWGFWNCLVCYWLNRLLEIALPPTSLTNIQIYSNKNVKSFVLIMCMYSASATVEKLCRSFLNILSDMLFFSLVNILWQM